jgi:hypothetical protein
MTIERVKLSYFLPELLQIDSFLVTLKEIKEWDDKKYFSIIDSILHKKGILVDSDTKEKDFVDSISGDFLDRSESIIESVLDIEALGAYDEVFTISVMQLGPTFLVRAPEFEDVQFFKNQDHAENWARDNYSSFIEALVEYNRHN